MNWTQCVEHKCSLTQSINQSINHSFTQPLTNSVCKHNNVFRFSQIADKNFNKLRGENIPQLLTPKSQPLVILPECFYMLTLRPRFYIQGGLFHLIFALDFIVRIMSGFDGLPHSHIIYGILRISVYLFIHIVGTVHVPLQQYTNMSHCTCITEQIYCCCCNVSNIGNKNMRD